VLILYLIIVLELTEAVFVSCARKIILLLRILLHKLTKCLSALEKSLIKVNVYATAGIAVGVRRHIRVGAWVTIVLVWHALGFTTSTPLIASLVGRSLEPIDVDLLLCFA